jgi:hypothetical protein
MNPKCQVIIEMQNPKPKPKIEGGRREIKYVEKWNNKEKKECQN